jgi:hypothetical protein
LGTVPLTSADWLVLALGVLWPVMVMEVRKAWARAITLGPPVASGTAPAEPQLSRTPRKD